WVQILLGSNVAHAAESCTPPKNNFIPFISLHLAGGAALSGNFVPHDAGAQLLPRYNLLGLGNSGFPIEREFGNVPFAGKISEDIYISKLLEGLRTSASASLSRTAFVGVCTRTMDDNGTNLLSVDNYLFKMGLQGTVLPGL